MKKLIFPTLIISTLLLTACGTSEEITEETPTETAIVETDQSSFMWQIKHLSHELTVYMESSDTMTLYDGTVEKTDHADSANDGKIYLLLELNLNKAEVGNAPFSWDDCHIEDSEGNSFPRLEDDLFLDDHNYERLPSTDLKLGENEGFIAFEIDETAAEGELYFVHMASEGENKIQIQ